MTGRILGFIGNRPELGAQVLRSHAHALDVPVVAGKPVGWGVGFYHGGELLLRRRPTDDRSLIPIAALVEKVTTDVFLGQVGHPHGSALSTENTQPFRYQEWLCAQAGGLPISAALRSGLAENQPEVLKRSRRGESDAELLFFWILSLLHEKHELHAPLLSPEKLCVALSTATQRLDALCDQHGLPHSNLDVLLTNGELLGVLHRSGTLGQRVVAGRRDVEAFLHDDWAASARSQSSEKIRCTVVAGPLAELPPEWQRLPHPAAITLTRTDDPRITPLL